MLRPVVVRATEKLRVVECRRVRWEVVGFLLFLFCFVWFCLILLLGGDGNLLFLFPLFLSLCLSLSLVFSLSDIS